MSKLNPPPRRDPPHFVDLNEEEVAHLLIRKAGITPRRDPARSIVTGLPDWSATLKPFGIQFSRNAVLLRSFRNV